MSEQQQPVEQFDVNEAVRQALTGLLSNPINVLTFQISLYENTLLALRAELNRRTANHSRPVLARVQYSDCFKIVIVKNEGVEGLQATITQITDNVEGDVLDPQSELAVNLTKLVLSQPVVIGDVWYVTTADIVHKHIDKMTESGDLAASLNKVAEQELTTPESSEA